MAHLILLEDEPVLREELSEFFEAEGHPTKAVGSLAEFHHAFSFAQHQIAVIDLGLPDGDGMHLIADLRAAGHRLGIIVLTARGGIDDRVAGLAGGADYYLPKTTDLSEMAAIVSALARRLRVETAPRWILQAMPRQLIPPGHAPIPLSTQDYTVMLALMTGKTITREGIVKALGADYFTYDQRRLDTQMRRLRRKVEQACGLSLPIATLRGVGFRFHADVDILR